MSEQQDTTIEQTGRCLCGKVEFSAKNVQPQVHVCHCNMCRQWGGSPSHSVHCGTEVSFNNAENITVYQSCDWAELGFCKTCGSHLFYRFLDGGNYVLSTGSFSDNSALSLKQQFFIDEKPDYYSYANATEDLTGAEVFAMYAQE